MIYLDANFFLTAFLYPDKEGEKVLQLLQSIYAGEQQAITSALTWDEVVYVVQPLRGRDAALLAGQSIFNSRHISIVACDTLIVQKATQWMRVYPFLDPRDAIHLATANHMNCDTIISEDKDFDKIKEIKRKWF